MRNKVFDCLLKDYADISKIAEEEIINAIKRVAPDTLYFNLLDKCDDLDSIYIRRFNEVGGEWKDERVLALSIIKNETGHDELYICSISYVDEQKLSKEELVEISNPNSFMWKSINDWSFDYVSTIYDILRIFPTYIPEDLNDEDHESIPEDLNDDAGDDVFDLSNYVVVIVRNPINGHNYELFVKTNSKENVIDELSEGLFFEDQSDSIYATIDNNIVEETLSMFSSHCIDLTNGTSFSERIRNGILSIQRKDDLDSYIIKRLSNFRPFKDLKDTDVQWYAIHFDLFDGFNKVECVWRPSPLKNNAGYLKTIGSKIGLHMVGGECAFYPGDIEIPFSKISTEYKLMFFVKILEAVKDRRK